MPKVFTKTNVNRVLEVALYITNGIAKIFLAALLTDGLKMVYNTGLPPHCIAIVLLAAPSVLYAIR